MPEPLAPLHNRLADCSSPYLRQHARDTVAWQPWDEQALAWARAHERPILLSIGYSACSGCHRMQRESFQSERVARAVNDHYLPILVDREERPDLDALYMQAVQELSGSAGWPLTAFLTPTGLPFFGGTYFPPFASLGQPGFLDVLWTLAAAWRERRAKVLADGERIARSLRERSLRSRRGLLAPDVLERSLDALLERYDARNGGFGGAPKFPRATDLRLCLRHGLRARREEALALASHSLERMARSAIHDQVGGGFHRYATDEEWRVPHYEKLLGENALLCTTYIEASLAAARPDFAAVARSTLAWAERELRLPCGAYASSLDAESAEREGGYYLWSAAELRRALGARLARWAEEVWEVEPEHELEPGSCVLHSSREATALAARLRIGEQELARGLDEARALLLAARARRSAPLRDEKVLSGSNAWMASALAQAAQCFGEPHLARRAAEVLGYLLEVGRRADGRLCASIHADHPGQVGTLSDHAYAVQAAIDLYETDFDVRWLREALALCEQVRRHYRSASSGGYHEPADDQEGLFARPVSAEDGAMPAGAGVQTSNLLRLAQLCGDHALAKEAEAALLAHGEAIAVHPAVFGQHLLALDHLVAPPYEIVIEGDCTSAVHAALLEAVRTSFRPQRVVACARSEEDSRLVALLRGKAERPAVARAWLCRGNSCSPPIEDPERLRLALRSHADGHLR